MNWDEKTSESEGAVWWQTSLHVLGSLLIFAPVTKVMALFLVLMVTVVQGNPVTSITGMIIFGAASLASLYLPTLLLKRSNMKWAAGIWGTIILAGMGVLSFAEMNTTNTSSMIDYGFMALGVVGATAVAIFTD